MQVKKESIEPRTIDLEIRKIYEEAKGTLSVVHEAVIKNDVSFLKSYEGREINSVDINGLTPLHYAAKLNRMQIAQILWEKAANFDQKDRQGYSPANYSAAHKDFMVFFIEKSVEFLKVDKGSESLLESIAKHQNLDMLRYIQETFDRLNIEDTDGRSVIDYIFSKYVVDMEDEFFEILIKTFKISSYLDSRSGLALTQLASSKRHETKLKMLLDERVDVNSVDSKGKSALHYAARNGLESTILILLDKGANIDLRDKQGQTPLYDAVLGNSQVAIEILLRRGANSSIEDDCNANPVHVSILHCRLKILELFMKKASIFGGKGTKGYSAMHFAALSNSEEMIRFVFDKKNRKFFRISTVDERDYKGRTPLHYASQKNCFRSAEILLELGASIDAVSDDLMSSIHYSVYAPSTETMKFLISKGAKKSTRAMAEEWTPLHLGVEMQNKEYVQVLLDTNEVSVLPLNRAGLSALQVANAKGFKEIALMIDKRYGRSSVSDVATNYHFSLPNNNISLNKAVTQYETGERPNKQQKR